MTQFYYPIGGARFSESNAETIDGVFLRNIEEIEFFLIEKSLFTDDLHMAFVLHPPVFCIFEGNGSDPNAFLGDTQRVIRALRLTASGAISDADEMITYVRSGSTNIREPRHRGRAFYEIKTEMSLTATLCSEAALTGAALRDFNRDRRYPAIDICEKMFQASYRLGGADDAERFLLLVSAIEALLGPYQEQQLSSLPWPVASQADCFVGLRPLRNVVAHGKSRRTEITTALEVCTRLLLREAIFTAAEGFQPDKLVGRPLIDLINKKGFRFAPRHQ